MIFGSISVFSRFCPNLSDMVLPLRNLITQSVEFNWTNEQEKAFTAAKDLIASSANLHYDIKLLVTLQVDAVEEVIGSI